MKKIIIVIVALFASVYLHGCHTINNTKSKSEYVATIIDKEALIGKKFSQGFLMGASSFQFVDSSKVIFTIYDKRSFGYKGTYEISPDAQSIKIQKIEKFGAPYMLQYINLEEDVILKYTGKDELNGYKLRE